MQYSANFVIPSVILVELILLPHVIGEIVDNTTMTIWWYIRRRSTSNLRRFWRYIRRYSSYSSVWSRLSSKIRRFWRFIRQFSSKVSILVPDSSKVFDSAGFQSSSMVLAVHSPDDYDGSSSFRRSFLRSCQISSVVNNGLGT